MQHERFEYGGVTGRLRLLATLSLLLVSATALAKPPPLSLDATQASQSLRGHIEFIFDASQTLTLEEAEGSDERRRNVGDGGALLDGQLPRDRRLRLGSGSE